MSNTETIDLDAKLQELLKLSPKQRIELAERLIASVPPYCGDPELERAWSEEIARRIEDIDRGRVQLIPAEEVHGRIERKLKERRAGQE